MGAKSKTTTAKTPTAEPGMMRPTRAEQQAHTRSDLIEAAARVFARRGFQAARVEEIAQEAGYSHGAVYSNFEGKEGLFLAVFEQYMADRIQEVTNVSEFEGTFAERARAGADQWMRRFGEDRATFLLHLEFMVHAARNPRVSKPFGKRMEALRSEIERRVSEQEAQIDATLPLSPAQLALIVRALGIGLAVEALNQPAEQVDAQLFGNFVALMASLLESSARPGQAQP
jgi:AcrR family transcriptional regulator